MSSGGNTLGIFMKEVNLTAHVHKLTIAISLPIGERMEFQLMSMVNILILLEEWSLKGYLLTPT